MKAKEGKWKKLRLGFVSIQEGKFNLCVSVFVLNGRRIRHSSGKRLTSIFCIVLCLVMYIDEERLGFVSIQGRKFIYLYWVASDNVYW